MHLIAERGWCRGSFHAFVEVVGPSLGDGKYRIQIPSLSTSLTRSTSQSCQRKVGVNHKKGEKGNLGGPSLLCVTKRRRHPQKKILESSPEDIARLSAWGGGLRGWENKTPPSYVKDSQKILKMKVAKHV